MRKAAILAGIVFVFCMLMSSLAVGQTTTGQGRLVANRAFLIDFGMYYARMKAEIDKNNKLIAKNKAKKSPTGLPTETFKMEAKDWALAKWEVELNSSASSVLNNVLSYATNVKSKYWAQNFKKYYDGQKINGYDASSSDAVLGVRIHFPTHRQNCWAKIGPPFEINAYDDDGKLANNNNGILDNVGQIKSISVWVKGRNYKNNLAIRLKDRRNVVREYYFGNLNFDNWRELTWVNPNYVENPKDRVLVRLPLYPRSRPFVKFMSFVVYRPMDMVGGDFILYIRDVKMSYDKAIADDDKDDIDDEKIWGILGKTRRKAKEREMLKMAEKKVLLEQEKAKLRKTRASR